MTQAAFSGTLQPLGARRYQRLVNKRSGELLKITRRQLLQHYGLVPVGKTRFVAMVDARDAALAQAIVWEAQSRLNSGVVARERSRPRRYLHVMVAERHLGPRPSPDHRCEHLNGDLLDCRLDNLAWTHKSETAWRKAKAAASA